MGYRKRLYHRTPDNINLKIGLDCPFKSQCTKSVHNRQIQVSFKLNAFKDNLHTEQGRKLLSRRGIEVESVFGRLKNNWSFRRFMLRGIEKVKIEWGLLSIAHNLIKFATILAHNSSLFFVDAKGAVSIYFGDSPFSNTIIKKGSTA